MRLLTLPAVVLITVWPCITLSASSPAFDISTIDTSPVRSQTVYSAFLVDKDKADLIVAKVREDGTRRLAVYLMQDGRFHNEPEVDIELPDDVILTEVCRLQSGDAFILYTRNQAVSFDPRTGIRRKLVEYSSLYNVPAKERIPRLDLCRDLNNDGLDDFIIPGFDGFQVFIQRDDNTFHDPVDIYAPPYMEMSYSSNPWYEARTLYQVDMNHDGRGDLVVWRDDHFDIYLQQDTGLFDADPAQLETDITFDHEGTDGLSPGLGEGDVSNSQSKALYQLADLDGDGIPDLVTLTVKSRGVFDKQTTYEIHKGRKGEQNLIEFEQAPVSRIQSEGIQFDMEEKDFNQDKQIDVVISSVRLGLGKILAALLTGSISVDVDFYQMSNGRYGDSPNVTRKIKATFDWSTGEVFYPTVLIADMDDDGLADLLVQAGENTLQIYPGRPDEELFERDSIDFEVPMPRDPELVELTNLNNDGRPDLIMQRRFPAKVVIMVSR
ncbi:MAG: VCBS repeat-containing protein [Pseudomonadales bacterium]